MALPDPWGGELPSFLTFAGSARNIGMARISGGDVALVQEVVDLTPTQELLKNAESLRKQAKAEIEAVRHGGDKSLLQSLRGQLEWMASQFPQLGLGELVHQIEETITKADTGKRKEAEGRRATEEKAHAAEEPSTTDRIRDMLKMKKKIGLLDLLDLYGNEADVVAKLDSLPEEERRFMDRILNGTEMLEKAKEFARFLHIDNAISAGERVTADDHAFHTEFSQKPEEELKAYKQVHNKAKEVIVEDVLEKSPGLSAQEVTSVRQLTGVTAEKTVEQSMQIQEQTQEHRQEEVSDLFNSLDDDLEETPPSPASVLEEAQDIAAPLRENGVTQQKEDSIANRPAAKAGKNLADEERTR